MGQLVAQFDIDGAQMDHVVECIDQLSLGERAIGPVGKTARFIDRSLSQFRHQRFIAGALAETTDHRGDLSVENRGWDFAGGVEEDFQILPPGMEDLE